MKKVKVIVVLVVLGLTLLLTGCVDDMATVNLRPDAEGSVQQWTPVPIEFPIPIHWTKVDDPVGIPDEDKTYVHTSVHSEIEEFNHATSALLVGATITNVRVYVRARATTGFLTVINIGIKVAGIRYAAAVDTSLSTSYVTYFRNWVTKPPLGFPWTKTDIDNLQSSIRLETDVTPVRVTQVYITVTYTILTPVAGKGLVSWTP